LALCSVLGWVVETDLASLFHKCWISYSTMSGIHASCELFHREESQHHHQPLWAWSVGLGSTINWCNFAFQVKVPTFNANPDTGSCYLWLIRQTQYQLEFSCIVNDPG
jgi:hypothetical protein